MSIKRLPFFLSAAKFLNFTEAAKEQFVSQTAISLQIKKYEDELGFRLFERNNAGVRLTAAGGYLYKRCQSITAEYNRAVSHARQLAEEDQPKLRIGYSGSYEQFAVTPIVQTFYRSKPDCQVELVYARSNKQVLQQLEDGFLDLAVIANYDRHYSQWLKCSVLRRDECVLLCSAESKLAKAHRAKNASEETKTDSEKEAAAQTGGESSVKDSLAHQSGKEADLKCAADENDARMSEAVKKGKKKKTDRSTAEKDGKEKAAVRKPLGGAEQRTLWEKDRALLAGKPVLRTVENEFVTREWQFWDVLNYLGLGSSKLVYASDYYSIMLMAQADLGFSIVPACMERIAPPGVAFIPVAVERKLMATCSFVFMDHVNPLRDHFVKLSAVEAVTKS